MKSIVIFYSLEGNCKLIANAISKVLSSDILELKLKKEVPKKGPLKFLIGGRSAMTKASPELATTIPDLSEYDLIFIGSPVWAGTFAPAIRTFASSAHLENKEIAFFACSGGGPTEKCISDLKSIFEGNRFVGQTNFTNPLKDTTAASTEAAKIWAEGYK